MASRQLDTEPLKINDEYKYSAENLKDHDEYKYSAENLKDHDEYKYSAEDHDDGIVTISDFLRDDERENIIENENMYSSYDEPDDDISNISDDEVVHGGIPIYLQGGNIGRIISGGATKFVMDDLEINLNLATDSNRVNQISYAFKLNNIEELDEWLASSETDFLAKCLRKFKFHFVYSNSLKGLFFDIVNLFEGYVTKILSLMFNGNDSKLNALKKSWIDYDSINNLESSSIILYQFGKDESLNKFLKTKSPNLFNYIKDKDKWSYLGWCPHVSDIRYRALLNFPLELVTELIGVNLDISKLSRGFSKIKKINSPSTSTNQIQSETIGTIKKKSLKDKSDRLHKRIRAIEKSLSKWETYYTACATQVMEIAKVWQNNFPEFGKQ